MSNEIRSYSSIFAVGHRAAVNLFMGPVVAEEKVDGSQFSFGVALDGTLMCRSKGQQIVLDAPEGMFARAVETAKKLAPELTPGWVYRAEYLQKPKHNALAYARVPTDHLILFDIDQGDQHYLSPDEKRTEAGRIGLEVVPTLFEGVITTPDEVKALLREESCLGGVQPEGVVVKNYARFCEDKKVLMGKYVTEHFKEVHKVQWKAANPGKGDVVERIIAVYRTEARWRKAIQHLRERGEITDSPKDIGALMKEVSTDVHKECAAEIAEKLFEWAWPQIGRGITAGLPQWYKDELLAAAFVPAEEVEAA